MTVTKSIFWIQLSLLRVNNSNKIFQCMSKKPTALCKGRISTINVFKLGEETHIHINMLRKLTKEVLWLIMQNLRNILKISLVSQCNFEVSMKLLWGFLFRSLFRLLGNLWRAPILFYKRISNMGRCQCKLCMLLSYKKKTAFSFTYIVIWKIMLDWCLINI